MSLTELMYEQAKNLDERSEALGELVDSVALTVASSTIAWLSDRLEREGDIILSTRNNFYILQQLPGFVKAKLDSSSLVPTIGAFVTSLSEEHDFANQIYQELVRVNKLPLVTQTPEDIATLELQGKIIAGALISVSVRFQQELYTIASKAIGSTWTFLTTAIAVASRKLAQIRQVSKDQAMTFFRLASDLLYRKAEKLVPIVYEYVGIRDNRNRPKCADWLDRQKPYWTRKEIAELDNGQGTDVFLNCGGYGCRHWWAGIKL